MLGLLDSIDENSRSQLGAVAYADGERRWTFSDFRALTNLIADNLASAGITAGDRVAALTKGHLDAALLMMGAMKTGAIFTPLNWRLSARELDYVLGNAKPKFVFVDAGLSSALEEIAHPASVSASLIDDVCAMHFADPQREPKPRTAYLQDGSAPALLLYSSGTTGLPKGVVLTGENLLSSAQTARDAVQFASGNVMANALPVFHIAGIASLLVPLLAGGRTEGFRDFDPPAFIEGITSRGITHISLVPSMIQMLLAEHERSGGSFGGLETISYAGSPISEGVLKKAIGVFKCNFVQIYGLTEVSGVATVLSSDEHRHAHLLQSAGRPAGDARIRIVDPAILRDVPEGQPGEIWIKSVRNMKEYWGQKEATDLAFPEDRDQQGGWLRTGDCGHVSQGYLYITDRLKDQIVSGGENVYPAEVEKVLVTHPAVADCAVIGVPDETWGETVKACVVLRPGAMASPTELIDFCRGNLAHYKCPKSVDFREALPRNASGKVLKRELREPYWKGMKRSVA